MSSTITFTIFYLIGQTIVCQLDYIILSLRALALRVSPTLLASPT